MHNQKKFRKYLKNGGDILLLIVSFLAGAFLAKRHAGMASGFMRLGALEIYLLFFFCLAWNFGARIFGLYDEFYNRSLRIEMIALGENILLQVFLAVAILFVVKSQTLSRFFVFTYYILLLVLLTLWKIFLRLLFSWLHSKGHNLSHILVIGSGTLARSFADTVTANHHLGFRLKGFIAEEAHPGMAELYLGKIDKLARVLEHEKIDEVIIAFPYAAIEEIGAVIAICENYPTQVRIIPEYFKFMSERFRISRFGAFPLFSIRANPLEQLHWRLLKRCFDLLFSLLLFVGVFSWLWPLLALLIKTMSPGPVFFKQERWGIKNKRIVCYKFRSMVKESRDVDENGHYQQASRDDPRVTRLGLFLRRSNLDELPQFINVVKGEMSVVGPRPHPTPMNLEAKDSIRHYQLRHLVKPGISGWAQVNGLRGETSDQDLLRQRVEADIWYIENWSFLLDLRIIWLSIWLMLKGDPRAY
ncbi:MAG: undecaprenyl-phosphate glucose phosphotransferase [Candidatus Aminicenantes bacterium]|nr:undecaprenyl-phosphate glucose phosphotransferase [Candidatus Aminicenantes bacterium]